MPGADQQLVYAMLLTPQWHCLAIPISIELLPCFPQLPGDMVVILCVVPANVDFATAGGIKLARAHDPEGERTMVGGRAAAREGALPACMLSCSDAALCSGQLALGMNQVDVSLCREW